VRSIDEIPLVKTNGAMTREAKLECIVARLQQIKAARPRTVKTLSSTISALFQKQLPEKEIEALVNALQKQALIAVGGKKVSYTLP
jgi:ferritin-like protein